MFSQGGAKKVGPWDPIVCVSAALTNECYHKGSFQFPAPSSQFVLPTTGKPIAGTAPKHSVAAKLEAGGW
jgi:hypothetical protein